MLAPVHSLVALAFIVAAAGSVASVSLSESRDFTPIAVSDAWVQPPTVRGLVLGLSTPAAVVWTDLVNVIAEGGDLEQVSGSCVGCADAGAHSTQQITGDGYFEFTIASSANHFVYAGLNTDASASTSATMPFALEISGFYVSVREQGVYKSDTSFVAGDVFRVSVESGTVKYYKNSNLFYTSLATPTYPLVADVSMQSVGSLLWGGKIATSDAVAVPSAPVIASFTASPSSITAGQSTRLSWNVTGATSLSVNQGVGMVTGATGETVFPSSTTAYTLSATNAAGSTTAATVTVSVAPIEVPPATSVCNTAVPRGQFAGCYYNNKDFTAFKFSRTDSYPLSFDWGKRSPAGSMGSDTFSVRWTGQFEFDAGEYTFASVVDDGLRLYVDDTLIIDKWSNTPGTYSVDLEIAAGWHTVRMDYYEQRGYAKAGLSWSKTSTPVFPVPIISSFTASPTSITAGQSATLFWSVSGATSLSINQGVGTVAGTTSKSVSPTATTTYTLTATNSSGSVTASATVTVNAVAPTTIVDGYGDTLLATQFNGWFFSQVGDTAAIITYENVADTTKTYTQTASRTISRPDAETWLKSTYGTNFTITQPLGFTVNPSTVVTAPGTYRIKSVKLNTSNTNILLGPSAQGTFSVGSSPVTAVAYGVDFATYLGGNGYDSIRDITTDGSGNIYVVGGTQSTDFPRTIGQTPAGNMDVFVTKLTPAGQVIWSQLLGGPNYDRAYAVEVDGSGNIYITGRAGRSFPLKNAFQTSFNGYYTGDAYGDQNIFLAKLNSGGAVLWTTYVGTGDMARDMAIDSSGNIYLATNYNPGLGQAQFPSGWFTNAYMKTPQGGLDEVIVKVDTNGAGVGWATYLGGSAEENPKMSIRVDNVGNLIILSDTLSTNAPVLNAYQATNRGGRDAYIVKMKSDGTGLLWATYFGGASNELNETHHLGVDSSGNAYIAVMTQSSDAPTTVGAYDRTYNGESTGGYFHAWGDTLVAKFSAAGQLVASTYVGGSGGDGPQGLGVDSQGNVYFSGGSVSTNYPTTAGAAVTTNRGGEDTIGVRLSADFTKIDYATFIGTSGNEEGRVIWADGAGAFYVGCEVASSGMQPLVNALQTGFGGGAQDACVAKFSLR